MSKTYKPSPDEVQVYSKSQHKRLEIQERAAKLKQQLLKSKNKKLTQRELEQEHSEGYVYRPSDNVDEAE